MDRGLYAAASAGLYQFRKLEVVNNNLANINTPGFKAQLLTSQAQSFDQTLASVVAKDDPYAKPDHDRVAGLVGSKTVTDFSSGPIKNTGNPLDVALRNPKQFFVINTPQGMQYTRAGNFTLNASGEIVTQDGCAVQGDGGSLTANGPGVAIAADGNVLVNHQKVGRLSIVSFDDPSTLERVGDNRFRAAEGSPAPAEVEGELEPESLEMANVSAISSMVELLTTQRAFQAYAKTSDTIDQMNQAAINQVGKRTG